MGNLQRGTGGTCNWWANRSYVWIFAPQFSIGNCGITVESYSNHIINYFKKSFIFSTKSFELSYSMKLFVTNFKDELNFAPFSYMHNIGVLE